jgi:minor extracellular serine protease Vpr
MQRLLLLFLLGFTAFCQTRSRLAEYAVVLQDEPVARKVQSRLALRSNQAQAHARTIRAGQSPVIAELQRRGATVEGATQMLVNAIVISATPEMAMAAREIAGVKYVIGVGRLKPSLDRALDLMNVSAGWAAVGGSSQAGAGIKIAIIDSGIDQNHPGFQDPSLTPPAGFPKGDTGFTNNKVIVARSYVQKDLAPGYSDSPGPAVSIPDDPSPRDRQGHGTAIAMIAAGASNKGPLATIQGMAPKAFLGNYKIFGSPGVAAFPNFLAFEDALTDALADGMDVATLSMNEGDAPTYYAPLDNLAECGGDCDVYSVAVENAVKAGMVVVVAAGNDGNIGQQQPTLNTIHRPGGAPSAITVGALMNAHELYQSVKVNGQTVKALFSDGPQAAGPISGVLRDVAAAGGDPQGCGALPSGSLAGAIALVQRGTCFFSDKINNAQNAGAVGVIVYQASGDAVTSPTGTTTTGIPAVMVGASSGATLKAAVGATATLDPSFTSYDSTPSTVWPASSRGPSYGDFGNTPTNVVKPEIAAIGANLYTATQKYDPNGDAYNASGYTGVTGTSYAVPFVAGAVALVKQKHPTWTPAQLKSAVVNTATQDVTENGATARVTSVGAGKLSVGDAVNAVATVSPATISFGPIATASLPISRTLTIFNSGAAATTFNLSVQGDRDNNATLAPTATSLSVPAGGSNSVTIRLSGTRPVAGSYQGFIIVSGGGQTLRVPYLYMVGSGIPADIFPIHNSSFTGGLQDFGWGLFFRTVDAAGVPVTSVPARFSVTQGAGTFTLVDAATDRLGNAGGIFSFGPGAGAQVATGGVQGLTPIITFEGFARPYPTISANGVVNAASSQVGGGVAPGSYVSIYGTALSDALHIESTPYLPVSLSDVSVSVDGGGVSQPAHIHFVSPGQVNVQIPWEFQGQTSAQMKVTLSTLLPGPLATVPLATYSPGIFEVSGLAAAQDANLTLITRSHPATRNGAIVLYVNGLGPVSNTPPSGEPSGASPLSQTTATPTVTIGGKQAQVIFSGLTPGVVGLYQINAILAADTPTGDQQITVGIGGVTSKASVLPVQ